MDIVIRPITADEIDDFRSHLVTGFGGDLREDDEDDRQRFIDLMPLERTRAAFDGELMVGTLGDFPLPLTVPGGSVPMAGTTMITVSSTHRRRGVLRSMIGEHLDGARESGDVVAGLWASESGIYGRFGYGLASSRYVAEMDAKAIVLTDDRMHGSLARIDVGDAQSVLAPVYETVAAKTPGMFARSDGFWRWRIFHDPRRDRGGSSALRVVVHTGAAGPDGYAIYRQKEKWEDFHSVGTVNVRELIAADAGAHTDLWRYLTNIDLFPNVKYWNLPVDDELPWRVADPRRVARTLWDALWVHVLDVPEAMSARRYRTDGRLAFEVTSSYFPDNDGVYELTVDGSVASCSPVTAEPDISLTAQALGAAYLGGQPLAPLARAGHVAGTPESIRMAERFLTWDVAPWCQEVF